MACAPFTVDFTMTPEELVAKARKAIENAGGTFNGDTSGGAFEISSPVKVKAHYTIGDASITLTVTDKPMIVPCSMIENKLREYLS